MTANRTARKTGFTLVEILIVVIILGILAAIVIPQFSNASSDARKSNLTSQLQTLRSQIELFKLQHGDAVPKLITASAGAWTDLTGITNYGSGTFGPYMQQAPTNPLTNSSTVAVAPGLTVGWVYTESTGAIKAVNADGTTDIND